MLRDRQKLAELKEDLLETLAELKAVSRSLRDGLTRLR